MSYLSDLTSGRNMFTQGPSAPAPAQSGFDYAGPGRPYLPDLAVDRTSQAYRDAYKVGEGFTKIDPAALALQSAAAAARMGSAAYRQWLRGNMMADQRRAANRVNLLADEGQSSEQALANAERKFGQDDPNFDYAPRSAVPMGRRAWSNQVRGF